MNSADDTGGQIHDGMQLQKLQVVAPTGALEMRHVSLHATEKLTVSKKASFFQNCTIK